jgi:hypothetical protein
VSWELWLLVGIGLYGVLFTVREWAHHKVENVLREEQAYQRGYDDGWRDCEADVQKKTP